MMQDVRAKYLTEEQIQKIEAIREELLPEAVDYYKAASTKKELLTAYDRSIRNSKVLLNLLDLCIESAERKHKDIASFDLVVKQIDHSLAMCRTHSDIDPMLTYMQSRVDLIKHARSL